MGDAGLEKLRETIQQRSIFLGKDHPVVSPKGYGQGWLIDLRMTLLDGASLELIADLFWERFAGRLPFQVGGLEAGAIPLVVAIAMAGQQRGTPVNAFVVELEPSTPRVAGSEFREVWRFRSPEPKCFLVVPKSTPALDDRRVFFGSDSGVFWALEQDTGAVAWSFRVREAGRRNIWSSP